MSDKPSHQKRDDYDLGKSFRVLRRTEAALESTVTDLRQRKDLPFRGGRINMQAVVNASWLMFEEMNKDELAAMLRPHLVRLEAMLRGESDPGYTVQVEAAKPVGISKSKPNRADARPADIDRPARISRKS